MGNIPESNNGVISDDAEPTAAAKGLRLIANAGLRKQMVENEVALRDI